MSLTLVLTLSQRYQQRTCKYTVAEVSFSSLKILLATAQIVRYSNNPHEILISSSPRSLHLHPYTNALHLHLPDH